jgi:hypothetical protein
MVAWSTALGHGANNLCTVFAFRANYFPLAALVTGSRIVSP